MPIDLDALPQSNVVIVTESASDSFDLRKQQSTPAAAFRTESGVTITDSTWIASH